MSKDSTKPWLALFHSLFYSVKRLHFAQRRIYSILFQQLYIPQNVWIVWNQLLQRCFEYWILWDKSIKSHTLRPPFDWNVRLLYPTMLTHVMLIPYFLSKSELSAGMFVWYPRHGELNGTLLRTCCWDISVTDCELSDVFVLDHMYTFVKSHSKVLKFFCLRLES